MAQMDLQSKQMDVQMQQMENDNTKLRSQVDMAQLQAEIQNQGIEDRETQSVIDKNKSSAVLDIARADAIQHDKSINTAGMLVDAITKLRKPEVTNATGRNNA